MAVVGAAPPDRGRAPLKGLVDMKNKPNEQAGVDGSPASQPVRYPPVEGALAHWLVMYRHAPPKTPWVEICARADETWRSGCGWCRFAHRWAQGDTPPIRFRGWIDGWMDGCECPHLPQCQTSCPLPSFPLPIHLSANSSSLSLGLHTHTHSLSLSIYLYIVYMYICVCVYLLHLLLHAPFPELCASSRLHASNSQQTRHLL